MTDPVTAFVVKYAPDGGDVEFRRDLNALIRAAIAAHEAEVVHMEAGGVVAVGGKRIRVDTYCGQSFDDPAPNMIGDSDDDVTCFLCLRAALKDWKADYD